MKIMHYAISAALLALLLSLPAQAQDNSTGQQILEEVERQGAMLRDQVSGWIKDLRADDAAPAPEAPLPKAFVIEFAVAGESVAITTATERFSFVGHLRHEGGRGNEDEPERREVREIEIAGSITPMEGGAAYLVQVDGVLRTEHLMRHQQGPEQGEEMHWAFNASTRLQTGETRALVRQGELVLDLTLREQ